jgi:hypothetical protein
MQRGPLGSLIHGKVIHLQIQAQIVGSPENPVRKMHFEGRLEI